MEMKGAVAIQCGNERHPRLLIGPHTHSWQPAGSPVHFKASDSALHGSLTPHFQTLYMRAPVSNALNQAGGGVN